MKTIVVTRHPALVTYLQEVGLIDDAEVLSHATPEEIEGNHVVGILPLHLAALAAAVTVVTLNVPQELRGQELTLTQVREFAGDAQTFEVNKV